MCATSGLPDGEVEGRAGLWGDAEVDRGVLPSLVPVDGTQHLNYLHDTDIRIKIFENPKLSKHR